MIHQDATNPLPELDKHAKRVEDKKPEVKTMEMKTRRKDEVKTVTFENKEKGL